MRTFVYIHPFPPLPHYVAQILVGMGTLDALCYARWLKHGPIKSELRKIVG
ncbi:hypothetical protein [Planktotalea sp.]|uniref:hypothetical protein n=1 Tax=Planktotalea sp. TaxID=2029877 RepID=UPI0025CF7EE5|nr:hypothetical protein [Planktotalea sp.]